MKTKQLLSTVLALLLALSLPAASASEPPAPDAGGLINVIVPSTGLTGSWLGRSRYAPSHQSGRAWNSA